MPDGHSVVKMAGFKANEYRVHQGGLMRCCLQTLSEHSEVVNQGARLQCRFCGEGQMRLVPSRWPGESGILVWEWDHD